MLLSVRSDSIISSTVRRVSRDAPPRVAVASPLAGAPFPWPASTEFPSPKARCAAPGGLAPAAALLVVTAACACAAAAAVACAAAAAARRLTQGLPQHQLCRRLQLEQRRQRRHLPSANTETRMASSAASAGVMLHVHARACLGRASASGCLHQRSSCQDAAGERRAQHRGCRSRPGPRRVPVARVPCVRAVAAAAAHGGSVEAMRQRTQSLHSRQQLLLFKPPPPRR